MVFHFLPVPAAADAEIQPTPGDMIQAGHLLSGGDWVALHYQANARAKTNTFCHRSSSRQSQKHIHVVRVVGGQLSTNDEGCLAAGRDMGVIRNKQGVKSPFFHSHG